MTPETPADRPSRVYFIPEGEFVAADSSGRPMGVSANGIHPGIELNTAFVQIPKRPGKE